MRGHKERYREEGQEGDFRGLTLHHSTEQEARKPAVHARGCGLRGTWCCQDSDCEKELVTSG